MLTVCGNVNWTNPIVGVLIPNVVSSIIEVFVASSYPRIMNDRNSGGVIDRDTHTTLDLQAKIGADLPHECKLSARLGGSSIFCLRG